MIAVLIPAHNEADHLPACLASVQRAASHPALTEPVMVIVALDRCHDATESIALAHGALVVHVEAPGGVGWTRATAASHAIERGATWLAMTDADSLVPADWLIAQRQHGCEVFCGIVQVEDWGSYACPVQQAFDQSQSTSVDHGRIHGANLGVSTQAYLRAGGFQAIGCGEDVALVAALKDAGISVAALPTPAVLTSARRQGRAIGGFADFLGALERQLSAAQEPAPNVALSSDTEHAGAGNSLT